MQVQLYRPLRIPAEHDPSLDLADTSELVQELIRQQINSQARIGVRAIQLHARRSLVYQVPFAVQVRERGVALVFLDAKGGNPVQAKLEITKGTKIATLIGVRLSLESFVADPNDKERLARYLLAEGTLREAVLELGSKPMTTTLSTGLGLHYDGPEAIRGGFTITRQILDNPTDDQPNQGQLGPFRTRYEQVQPLLPNYASPSCPVRVIGQLTASELMLLTAQEKESQVDLMYETLPVRWLGHHDPNEYGTVLAAFGGLATFMSFVEQLLSFNGSMEALRKLGYKVEEAPKLESNPLTAEKLGCPELTAPWV